MNNCMTEEDYTYLTAPKQGKFIDKEKVWSYGNLIINKETHRLPNNSEKYFLSADTYVSYHYG